MRACILARIMALFFPKNPMMSWVLARKMAGGTWEMPVQEGDVLYITQAFSVTQTGDEIEVL